MKNVINYFYNFNIDNLRMIHNNYYFIYQSRKFVFQEIRTLQFDYQSVYELNKILMNNNESYFQIIINRNNEILTYAFNKKYILMLDNTPKDRNFNFYDLLKTNIIVPDNNKIIDRLNRSNWIYLWGKKIDYFEYFIEHNINKYVYFNKYVNYFIGLGENAILYVKNTMDSFNPSYYDQVVISHSRIDTNSSLKQLYNPLNLVIDHPSRDISEYLKMLFWNHCYKKIDIRKYLNEIKLSNYGARLLMARMLFPSFFFDSFEKLVEDEINENDILHIIDRIEEYEEYLLTVYFNLKLKYVIPEISWLKKVDYSSTLITPSTSGTSFISIDSIPSLSVTSIMLQ